MIRMKSGAVVLIASIAGMIGTKGYGVYGAGKAAVVSSGPVDTAMFDAVPDQVRDALTNLIPLRRLGLPGRGGGSCAISWER
jgi:hypothetical protein